MTAAVARRWASILLLIMLAALAAHFLFGTEAGAHWRDRNYVHAKVHDHRLLAPLAFVGAYLLLSVLLLPIWWVQVLAGYCLGIVPGILVCEAGATIAAVTSVALSRWLAADWFHRRVETQLTRLRALDAKLGKNGLLVVMSVRLLHVVPFAISNYALGLLDVSLRDVALGTLIGGLTTNASYVAAGALGRHLLHEWWFMGGILALNLSAVAAIWLIHRRMERRREAQNSRG